MVRLPVAFLFLYLLWGLTLHAFDHGPTSEPSPSPTLAWAINQNIDEGEEDPHPLLRHGPVIGIFMLAGLFVFFYRIYRDYPEPGEWCQDPTGRANPPGGHSPGGARFFLLGFYDIRCWLGDLGSLWDKGLLTIAKEKQERITRWVFRPTQANLPENCSSGEALLWKNHFSGKDELRVSFTEVSRDFFFWDVVEAHERLLKKLYRPRYFSFRVLSLIITLTLSISVGVASIAIADARLLFLIFPLWIANLLLPWIYRKKLLRYSSEGRQLFQELYGYKATYPLLPDTLPDSPDGSGFSMGWSVALEEDVDWWADLALQADYAWNLKALRNREMNTHYQAQKGYAREQAGKILPSQLGPRWQRKNPLA
ncbi:MAG: DUF2207 domain-containing protein [Opitutales bacterium]|nr:DUF2207 domain-containing protein [Opitutales bacterium]